MSKSGMPWRFLSFLFSVLLCVSKEKLFDVGILITGRLLDKTMVFFISVVLLPIDVLRVFLALLKFSSESVCVAVTFCANVSISRGEGKLDTLFICRIGIEDARISTGNDKTLSTSICPNELGEHLKIE